MQDTQSILGVKCVQCGKDYLRVKMSKLSGMCKECFGHFKNRVKKITKEM